MAIALSSLLHSYFSPPRSRNLWIDSNYGKGSNFSTLSKLDRPTLICHSSKRKISFMDQILDYIEGIPNCTTIGAFQTLRRVSSDTTQPTWFIMLQRHCTKGGPKLRKWYGAPDQLPKDGALINEGDEYPEEEEMRDAVLVTDGDSEMGQMIILSLIIKRTRVKALVKDKRAAAEAFGAYVESIAGDASDGSILKKALRGVRAIICPNEGFFSDKESLKGLQHIVLLSQLDAYRGSSGVLALMTGNKRKLAEKDESLVIASGIPYTIIRAGLLENTPGGNKGFCFKEGSAAQGRLSKEDAAFICVEALDTVPQRGIGFEVVNGEEKVSDWKEFFASLAKKAEQQQQPK